LLVGAPVRTRVRAIPQSLMRLFLALVLSVAHTPGGVVEIIDSSDQISATQGLSGAIGDGHEDASAETDHLGRGGDAMSELLHWAVQHSDADRIKELMEKYREQNLTITDVYGKDLVDALFVNEASVMQEMIEQIIDFHNASMPEEQLQDALERLQELVEQVDNAGNLHRMGGLAPLLDLAVCEERAAETRTLALWTVGVAVQNNPPVQADLLGLQGLKRLVDLLPRCDIVSGFANGSAAESGVGDIRDRRASPEYCGKLLFTLSGLVRNDAATQAAADDLGLFDWLLDVGARHEYAAVAKKALSLLDIVLAQNPALPFLDRVLDARQDVVALALIARVQGAGGGNPDMDAVEKVLRLINRFLSLRPMLFARDFRSQLDLAVHRVTQDCVHARGAGDEGCEGLAELAKDVDTALAARDVGDEEL